MVVLCYHAMPSIMRLTRAGIMEVLSADYIAPILISAKLNPCLDFRCNLLSSSAIFMFCSDLDRYPVWPR